MKPLDPVLVKLAVLVEMVDLLMGDGGFDWALRVVPEKGGVTVALEGGGKRHTDGDFGRVETHRTIEDGVDALIVRAKQCLAANIANAQRSTASAEKLMRDADGVLKGSST